MIDRSIFTPDGSNPPFPVPISDNATVPTEQMATLLADALGTNGKVLEIGTGSGYQTAILAERCSEVVSIEIAPIESAIDKLPPNVTLIVADGRGYDTGEEFDGVLVTFAAKVIQPVWVKQLREGGRLVVPLEFRGICSVAVFEKRDGALRFDEIVCYAPFTAQEV